MKLLLSTVVWGVKYTDLFLNYCLPTILSEGNIPSVKIPIHYLIITTEETLPLLKNAERIKELSKYCTIIWDLIEVHEDKYITMNEAYRRAIKLAHGTGSHLRLMSPDILTADGSLPKAIDLCKDKDALVIPTAGLRVTENCLPHLRSTMDTKYMGRLLKEFMHVDTSSHITDSPHFHQFPTQIIFDMGDRYFIKSFFYQVYLIKPTSDNCDQFNVIEADLLVACGTGLDRVKFLHTNDSVCELSITPDPYYSPEERKFSYEAFNNEHLKHMNVFTKMSLATGYMFFCG